MRVPNGPGPGFVTAVAAAILVATGCARTPDAPPASFDAFPDAFATDGGTFFDLGGGENPDMFQGNAVAGMELPVGPNAGLVATGDFDGDGLTDVAVAAADPSASAGATVAVFFQNGSGGLTESVILPAGETELTILMAGDVDGDGRDDLIWAAGANEVARLSAGRTFGDPIVLPRPQGVSATNQGTILHLEPGPPASVVFLGTANDPTASTLYVVSGIVEGETPKLFVWPKAIQTTKILNRPNRVPRGLFTPAMDMLYLSPKSPETAVSWFGGDGAGGLKELTSFPFGVSAPVGAIETAYETRRVILFADSPQASQIAGGFEGTAHCSNFLAFGTLATSTQASPVLVGYVPDLSGSWAAMLWAAATTTATDTTGVTFFKSPLQYDYGAPCGLYLWLDQVTGQVDLVGPIVSMGVLNVDNTAAVVAVHGPAGARHASVVTLQGGRLAGTKAISASPTSGSDGGVPDATPDAETPDATNPSDGADLPDGRFPGEGGTMVFDGGVGDGAGPGPSVLCEQYPIDSCETSSSLATFCPKGRFAAGLFRCDGSLSSAPSPAYLENHLCGCGGGRIGSCCEGVAFSSVACCLE